MDGHKNQITNIVKWNQEKKKSNTRTKIKKTTEYLNINEKKNTNAK